MFYRQELGDRWSSGVGPLSLCTICRFDFREIIAEKAAIFDCQAFLILRLQMRYLSAGWTFNDKQIFQYSRLYYDVLRNLVQKMMSPWTTRRLLDVASQRFTIPPLQSSRAREPFENFSVAQRHALLQVATWYLLDWPDRFHKIFRENRCRYSELMRDFENPPYWFYNDASLLEHLPVGPCSEEIASMRVVWSRAQNAKERTRLRGFIKRRLNNMRWSDFLQKRY
jgi:hypothetical protein